MMGITTGPIKQKGVIPMHIGEQIKKLRREKGLTQERLAELLSLSPQAVSRWETGSAMPDLSMVVPLANLFGVTTDCLLGAETYLKDLRRAEYDEAFREYWRHDDKEKNYEIAVRAVAEYPGDMGYLEWLASAEFYHAFDYQDDATFHALLDRSAEHYRLVLESDADSQLKSQARNGLVLALSNGGRKEEAREAAMQEKDEKEREKMLVECLEGEEKRALCQKLADRGLYDLVFYLKISSTDEERYCDLLERLLELLFPDGNYQFYHNTMQYALTGKAFALCRAGRYEEVVPVLRKAKYHAEKMTELSRRGRWAYTSPYFDLRKGEKPVTDSEMTDVDDFQTCLRNNRCFDPLREKAEFQELFEP